VLTGDHQVVPIPGANPKLTALDETLEEVTGKVLIFVMFRHTLSQLVAHLGPHRAAWLRGDMKPGDIKDQVQRFAGVSECRYMVAQIQSGKYGHTFLGGSGEDRCSTTVFYEHSYSLDNRVQAEDRNHRIGQDRAVVYVDLVGPRVEKMIVKALKNKQNVADAVVDGLRHGDL
jgi:SNF2 family DNA or RNA helicase